MDSSRITQAVACAATAGALSALTLVAAPTAQAATPSVSYAAHVSSVGWQAPVSDGATAGTTGQALQMEALKITTSGATVSAHVSGIGWMAPTASPGMSGTTGKGLRMEAVKVHSTLTGYALECQAHVAGLGWLGWVGDNQTCGTTGKSLQMEAVRLRYVPAASTVIPRGSNILVQETGTPSLSTGAKYVDFDADDIISTLVNSAHAKGLKVGAYFSIGTLENWRSDYTALKAINGTSHPMSDWAGEYWVTGASMSNTTFVNLMKARIDKMHNLGVDFIDPDNTDGYDNTDADGTVSKAQDVTYWTTLANYAHSKGMGFGIKNSIDLLPSVQNVADFAVNEECGEYAECSAYAPMLSQGKAVVSLEYTTAGYNAPHSAGMQVQLRDGDLGLPIKAQRFA